MLQARVTIKSLLTGHQPLFTDRARACAPSSLHGAPEGSWCWGHQRWPRVARDDPGPSRGGTGTGAVAGKLQGSPRSPTRACFWRKEAVAVSECSWHACPSAVRPLPPKLHFLVPPSCTNREFFHPSFLPEHSHGSHVTASLK